MPDDDTPRPRPTMDDVAARAGVSQMTVSRALRGTGYISEELRARVRKAAAELGYVHNRLAGGLRGQGSQLVAVVLPTLQNRVFTEALDGINAALGATGMQPVFGVTEYAPEREAQLVTDLLSWRPSGIILSGLEHDAATREAVIRSGIRSAEIMDIDGTPIAAAFGLSQRAAGESMARHLLERGYRRFAWIGAQGGRDLRAGKRLDAFAATIRAGGGQMLHSVITDEASSMPLGRRLTSELLARRDRPAAICYSNDDLAAGGVMHCIAEGIAVPREVALAGFNGLSFLEALPQRLTTIETPRHEIGRAAAAFVTDPNAGGGIFDLGFRLVPGDTS